jgi:hypothetical protein
MQTRTYGDLFSLISNMIGAVELASDEQTQVANFINRRYFEAYQTSPVWPRYVITGEARTISPDQIIKYAEDSFLISAAGNSNVNGLYQYGPEYSGHNSYVLNGNTLSFEVTSSSLNSDIVGTYKLDATYDPTGSYSRGVWVNQTNGKIVFIQNNTETNWIILNIATDDVLLSVSSTTFFPWQNVGFNGQAVISGNPETAYNIERNDSNNHWELMQQDADGTATVLYKDANGNIPSETAWEIVNAPNPTPIVHDLDTINEFIRIHRSRSFFNNSAKEYDFYADASGGHILNITTTDDDIAYVTYKKIFEKFSPTLSNPVVSADYYDSDLDVPEEFFNYIAHTVYADFLRVQNKQEEAIAEENVGAKYLAQELEKVDIRMNNSTINKRFSTYVNRQSR